MNSESLKKAKIGKRLAREYVARHGWSGSTASFAVDRERADRDRAADARSSGADFDPEFTGTAGGVIGRPVRRLVWSARLDRFVWWRFEQERARWWPEGVDRAVARRLRVEVSDAHEGRSVEEVFEEGPA